MKQACASGKLGAVVLMLALLCFAAGITSELIAFETGGGRSDSGVGSCNGYTLFSPIKSTTTYLIDNRGDILHTWPSGYEPGQAVYLLDDDSILRTIRLPGVGGWGGTGGGVEKIAWGGTVTWHFEYSSGAYLSHHDIEPLPNGNVLLIAWDFKTRVEAVAAGRQPALIMGDFLMSEQIIEVQPTGPTSGEIVWQWNLWDHLIQDFDPSKSNYGGVGDHRELLDINFPGRRVDDWIHANSVDFNPDLDQIVISCHNTNEIWIIDHSTTTAEAAGHSGGNSGMGGDLLYRWGNPQSYRAGSVSDQKLFGQHDAQWIEPGYPGEGNILIFNNGRGRPGGDYSSVDEIEPPVDANGHYCYTPGSAFGPSDPVWIFTAANPFSFYAQNISGAVRLPNGNTLICDGPAGRLFEVTLAENTVWEYVNAFPSPLQNSVFKIRRYDHNIWCYPESIPAGTGGAVEFTLFGGEDHAGRPYVLLGSTSGTSPGTLLPGGFVTIPLNRDWVTDRILANLNNSTFANFSGMLDGSGSAVAYLNAPPIPAWAGTTIHFAYTTTAPCDFASIPVALEVVP